MGRATPTPRPSKVPSLRYSSRIRFRTGVCSAAQSIFLCPSGARDASLTSDSLCIRSSLILAHGVGFGLGRFDLLATAEEQGADHDEGEEGDQDQAQRHAGGLGGEAGGGEALAEEAEAEAEAHDQAAE